MRKAKKAATNKKKSEKFPVFTCSFCGKPEELVRKLICGPGAFICNGCIQLGNDILLAEVSAAPVKANKKKSISARNGVSPKAFRERMFDAIVEQLVDNEIWKEGCKQAMTVNKITEKDVNQAVQKRLKSARSNPSNPELLLEQRIFLALNHISGELSSIKAKLGQASKHRNGR
jgi:hypothetical protein